MGDAGSQRFVGLIGRPSRPVAMLVQPVSVLLATVLLVAVLFLTFLLWTVPAANAQLTLVDNRLFDEDDFDTADAFNFFGAALARCDYNGDGYEDLAASSPAADLLVVIDTGKVHVVYGGPLGLTVAGHQTVIQPPAGQDGPDDNDQFGEALAAADFDGDGYCDLAVGRPSASFNGETEAGLVHVFYGTASGLDTSQSDLWWQGQLLTEDESEDGDRFGSPLAAADFDQDGYGDLAVGVPFEDDGAGAVHVFYGSSNGLTAAHDDLIAQGDALGALGFNEADDHFGSALTVGFFDGDEFPDLAVSAPGEDAGGVDDVGWVHVFFANEDRFEDRASRQQQLDQLHAGEVLETGDAYGLALAAGDFDGDGFDDLVIGSAERVGNLNLAGSIAGFYGEEAGLGTRRAFLVTQDDPCVSDQAEFNDGFGRALAAGDFDGDGRSDLAVGVPFEDFESGGLVNNGAVHAFYGSIDGLTCLGEQFHGQGVWGAGATESGDFFGQVLVAGDFDSDGVDALIVGVPREDRAAGADAGVLVYLTGRLRAIFFDDFESGDLNAWGEID